MILLAQQWEEMDQGFLANIAPITLVAFDITADVVLGVPCLGQTICF
jgi:hypothetical protein